MKYKNFSDVIVVRLDINDEILESIKAVCAAENVRAGYITAIGALKSAVMGVYNVSTGEYSKHEFNEFTELTSLVGNVSYMNDEPYIHLHATLGKSDGSVVGGHMNSGVIGATCEIFIHRLEGTIPRVFNPESGLNVFDL